MEKNYKEKINYANNVDIVIADVGTTTIACCEISKKPVEVFLLQSLQDIQVDAYCIIIWIYHVVL